MDGYDLGVISMTLPFITKALGASPLEAGLIVASSLIGIFFGAPLTGLLTDRIGRRVVFSIDLALFVVLGALQAVVTEPWQLLVVAAVVLSYALLEWAGLSWRWVLATSALPAVVTLVLRAGFPESPRWLVSNGRPAQARQVDRFLGAQCYESEQIGAGQQADGGLRAVFNPENRRRLLPTEVRTSGVGVAAAVSRIGAAVGTFLLPLGINALGIGACMLNGAGYLRGGRRRLAGAGPRDHRQESARDLLGMPATGTGGLNPAGRTGPK